MQSIKNIQLIKNNNQILIYSYISRLLILVLFLISNFELTHYLFHKIEDLGQNHKKTLHFHLDSTQNNNQIHCENPNLLLNHSQFDIYLTQNSIFSFSNLFGNKNSLSTNYLSSCFAHNQTHHNFRESIDAEIEVKLDECLLHILNINFSYLLKSSFFNFDIHSQIIIYFSQNSIFKSFLDFISLSNKAPPYPFAI